MTEKPEPASTETVRNEARSGSPTVGQAKLWQAGRTSWSLVGIAVLVVAVMAALARIPLVVIPVVLALFPATLLVPVAAFLKRRGVPSALAALASVLAAVVLVVGTLTIITTLVVAQLPELLESASGGLGQVESFLEDDPLGVGLTGFADVIDAAGEQLGEVGELAPQALQAAIVAFEFVAGMLILLVVLFFYLKDGSRLTEGVLSLVPSRFRGRTRAVSSRAWDTLGKFFRGQLLVALVDAVVIGIGLLILGVPLAIPLMVLIFFGGMFPIVGAVATGALAVLVALADTGLTTGLIVLGLILAVQQLESNILEPIILGRAIRLHPLAVLLAITIGAVTIGILGAFLAVPVAAVIAETIAYLRSGEPPAPPPGEQDKSHSQVRSSRRSGGDE